MKRYDQFIIILNGGNGNRNDTRDRCHAQADTCQYFLSSLWAEGLRKDKAHS